MVDYLVTELVERGITVQKFELTTTDIGKLAMALVNAATIIIGTPAFLVGAHPHVISAAALVNALRPKLRYAAIIGSYGWGNRAVEQVSELMSNLQVEMLAEELFKGLPDEETFKALDDLVEVIEEKHADF